MTINMLQHGAHLYLPPTGAQAPIATTSGTSLALTAGAGTAAGWQVLLTSSQPAIS